MERRNALRSVGIAIALSVLAFSLVACGPRVPSGAPSVSGVIRQVAQYPGGLTAVVYGPGGVERIAARVDTSTVILREKDGRIIEGFASEVVPGALASVWIDGPLAESYPAQGHAGTVLVRER